MARKLSKKYMNLDQEEEIHGLSVIDIRWPNITFLYNDEGEVAQVQFTDGRRIDFSFDDEDRVTAINYYRSDGSLYYRYVFSYNDEGEVTQQTLEE